MKKDREAALWGVIAGWPFWLIEIEIGDLEILISGVTDDDRNHPQWFLVTKGFLAAQIATTHPGYFGWTKPREGGQTRQAVDPPPPAVQPPPSGEST